MTRMNCLLEFFFIHQDILGVLERCVDTCDHALRLSHCPVEIMATDNVQKVRHPQDVLMTGIDDSLDLRVSFVFAKTRLRTSTFQHTYFNREIAINDTKTFSRVRYLTVYSSQAHNKQPGVPVELVWLVLAYPVLSFSCHIISLSNLMSERSRVVTRLPVRQPREYA